MTNSVPQWRGAAPVTIRPSIWFRPYKGGFEANIKNIRQVPPRRHWLRQYFGEEVQVIDYDDSPDPRIGWDKTFLVINERRHVLGFCDRKPI